MASGCQKPEKEEASGMVWSLGRTNWGEQEGPPVSLVKQSHVASNFLCTHTVQYLFCPCSWMSLVCWNRLKMLGAIERDVIFLSSVHIVQIFCVYFLWYLKPVCYYWIILAVITWYLLKIVLIYPIFIAFIKPQMANLSGSLAGLSDILL